MLKGHLCRFFCGVCVIATLTSCGSEENLGGGIGEFTTVSASAVADTNRLESDLLTGNTCSDAGSADGTLSTDIINVAVTSKALFPSGNLDLLISKITVQYQPANALTPPLPDYFISTRQTIAPGQTVSVPVAVLTDNYKFALATRPTQSLQPCSMDMFEYYVRIVFEVSEPGGNGKTRNVTADLTLAVADRV